MDDFDLNGRKPKAPSGPSNGLANYLSNVRSAWNTATAPLNPMPNPGAYVYSTGMGPQIVQDWEARKDIRRAMREASVDPSLRSDYSAWDAAKIGAGQEIEGMDAALKRGLLGTGAVAAAALGATEGQDQLVRALMVARERQREANRLYRPIQKAYPNATQAGEFVAQSLIPGVAIEAGPGVKR